MSKSSIKNKRGQLQESMRNETKKPKATAQQAKVKEYPRSYRLYPELMTVLNSTLERVNAKTPKKVSEARLIKALVFLSKDIDEEKIIKALKEIW